jgi:hypothetical protein
VYPVKISQHAAKLRRHFRRIKNSVSKLLNDGQTNWKEHARRMKSKLRAFYEYSF